MKNLKKILMVVCCFCLTFLFAACDLQKDVNIVSITVVETTIPAEIEVGKFDQAGIQIRVDYADQTHETIGVTTTMLGDEYGNLINTPGTYTIGILFRGATTKLTVKIVPAEDVYAVSFYNGNNELISRQMVQEGADAEVPNPLHVEMQGFRFIGWDRTFTNVQEDLNVYGIYTRVDAESEGEGVAYNEILFKAVSQMENGIFNRTIIDELGRNRTDETHMYKNGQLNQITIKDHMVHEENGLIQEDLFYVKISRELGSTANYIHYEETYGANGYNKNEISADGFKGCSLYSHIKDFVSQLEFTSIERNFYGNNTVYVLTLVDNNKSHDAPVYTKIYFNESQILMIQHLATRSSSDKLELELSVYFTMHPTTYVEFPYEPNEG